MKAFRNQLAVVTVIVCIVLIVLALLSMLAINRRMYKACATNDSSASQDTIPLDATAEEIAYIFKSNFPKDWAGDPILPDFLGGTYFDCDGNFVILTVKNPDSGVDSYAELSRLIDTSIVVVRQVEFSEAKLRAVARELELFILSSNEVFFTRERGNLAFFQIAIPENRVMIILRNSDIFEIRRFRENVMNSPVFHFGMLPSLDTGEMVAILRTGLFFYGISDFFAGHIVDENNDAIVLFIDNPLSRIDVSARLFEYLEFTSRRGHAVTIKIVEFSEAELDEAFIPIRDFMRVPLRLTPYPEVRSNVLHYQWGALENRIIVYLHEYNDDEIQRFRHYVVDSPVLYFRGAATRNDF